eukprot:jgi/Botrbrau1/6261/Bobra.0129s0013.1
MVLLISVFLLLAIPMEPHSTVVNITPSSLAARNQQRVEQHTRDSEARCREAGISPAPLMVASTGNGEDSNRFIPLGDSVSRVNMLIGDAIGHPHHHGKSGISEVDAHELRAAASQLGTLFEGAMGHGGLQTSSHIPPCPPLPSLTRNSSSTRRLSRRRLMDNKRGYPFPKVTIPLARKAPPARIARGAMGHQAPSWPLPASLYNFCPVINHVCCQTPF